MRSMNEAFRITAVCAVLFAALSAARGTDTAERRAPELVVDTDMGLDDVRALFALLPASETRIERIVVTEGSSSRAHGVENLSLLLDAMHEDGITIFEGAPLRGEAPHWRENANSLGGCPVAYHAAAAPAAAGLSDLRTILSAERAGINYLALGPLTSAASLAADPRTAAVLDTVWIPARVRGAEVSGWNLTRDAESADLVMKTARCVVLIDVGDTAPAEAAALFSSLEESAPAGRWIRCSLASAGGHDEHAFLYDEIAAAALARPALIDIERKTYRIERARGVFALASGSGGTVRLARMKRAGDAAAALRELWRASPHFDHHDTAALPVVDLLKAFHGHLGPYVVIGYRMGRLALEATGAEGHFDISAVVHSVLETPQSCLIDGVQLGAGCTIGKRNIAVHETDGPAYAVFEAEGGARVTIRLRPEAAALVVRLIDEEGVEAAGMHFLEMDREALFEVSVDTSSPALPPAR